MSIESVNVSSTAVSCAAENLGEVWFKGGRKKVTGRVGDWQIDAYRAIVIDPELVHPEIIKALPRALSIGKYTPEGWNQVAHIVFGLNGKVAEVEIRKEDEDRVEYLLDNLRLTIDGREDPKEKWQTA